MVSRRIDARRVAGRRDRVLRAGVAADRDAHRVAIHSTAYVRRRAAGRGVGRRRGESFRRLDRGGDRPQSRERHSDAVRPLPSGHGVDDAVHDRRTRRPCARVAPARRRGHARGRPQAARTDTPIIPYAVYTLGIILARAGSKGLRDKCVRPLLGRAMIEYTFEHARAARGLDAIVLTTDSAAAQKLARNWSIEVIDRPADLATDTATVDAAARHAVKTWEARHDHRVDAVALLYANIPVRALGVIDRAIAKLVESRADSVRTVAPVGKHHPDWLHRLEGDRMIQYRPNSIYRRQDLEPLYYHDGAVVVVTRDALFAALRTPDDNQAFLGRTRCALVQRCEDAVDVDEPLDLLVAEAVLRARSAAEAPA
ncbi:MAG: acylneuraminate cytidylyltransferase family protein [Planctomycetota bacterium]|nr:MAG: acylneuraminate cytidylyltransferase family protein [Planctomycetota bacterium]